MKAVIFTTLLVSAMNCSAEDVSFSEDILPVFRERCVHCQLTGSEAAKLSLVPDKAYQSLFGVEAGQVPTMKRVAPGKTENSYLIRKFEGAHLEIGGRGTRMHRGSVPMKAGVIEAFGVWVKDGARKN